jgi:hypothetical protein
MVYGESGTSIPMFENTGSLTYLQLLEAERIL